MKIMMPLTKDIEHWTFTSSLFLTFQRFPLGGDDEVMSSTLQQFSKVIDEVNAYFILLG